MKTFRILSMVLLLSAISHQPSATAQTVTEISPGVYTSTLEWRPPVSLGILPAPVIEVASNAVTHIDTSTNLFDLRVIRLSQGAVYRGSNPESFESSTEASFYFLEKSGVQFGSGLELIAGNTDNIAHDIFLNGYARYPLGNVAFDAEVSFGMNTQTTPKTVVFGAGGGIEYAFTKTYSTRASARYLVEKEKSDGELLCTLAVNYSFK